MFNALKQALSSRINDVGTGMLLGVGMPEYPTPGGFAMSFAGTNFQVDPRNPMAVSPIGDPVPTNFGHKLWGLVGVAGFAYAGPVMGFMDNGLAGAVRNTIIESSLNAHMFRHGHHIAPYAAGPHGVGYFAGNPGRLLKGIPGGRFVDYLGRYGAGAMLAYGAYDLVGGGPLGFAAAHAAGGLGTKHAGKMTMGFLAYSGARLAFKGTHAMLKAGYRFKQRQKMVQTDGDMSAFMTQGAFTMRERAVEAINRSHLNARSALGQEANYMHSNRSYSSPYRKFY